MQDKEKAIVVRQFSHDSKVYQLVLYLNDDDRVEVHERMGEKILNTGLVFTAMCEIQLKGKTIGRISYSLTEPTTLEYCFYNDPEFRIGTGISVNDVEAYFKAEERITLQLLTRAKTRGVSIGELVF